ncbi:hypothetical protein FRC14_002751 [Serendipita sp. 396]|nr:hypothetical protein FRC14_002751 [Serendipita sp. 396]KAG8803974.1 hypothetical protein FRC16_001691 [Serendipita sp. 398]
MSLDGFETSLPSEIPSGNAVDTTDFGDPLENISATGSRMTVFLDDTHFMNTSSRNHSTAIFDPESTSISILATSDDPLPFSSLSPSAFSRDSWHNLSVIFEISESTNSLPERSLSNQDGEDVSKTSSFRENVEEPTKNVEGKRYRLPLVSSLAPRLGRLRELSPPKAINVAQRIAYFENSSRGSAVSSFRSSPSPKTDARRSLQTTLTHQPTHLLPNARSSPSSSSYGDTKSLGERLQIGLVWFLDTHKRSNARWVRCKATLYRSVLHLAWHAPDLKRYVAQLDLLKCTDVRSTPTLSHPSMTEDPGAIAWNLGNIQGRVSEGDIFPIQMVYADGTERIGTNNLRERLSWVASIWNAINSNVSGNPQRCTSTGLSTVNGPNSVKTSEPNIQSTLMSVPTTQGTGSADHDYLRRHFRSFSSDDVAWSAQDGRQPLSKFIRARNNLYPGRRPHQRDLSEERPSGTTSSISSTPPSSPRIRAVSLKYISSLLSSRTLRHEESHPLNSSQSTMSESLYRTAPESKGSSSVVSSQITTLESEARLRPSRLRKTKPRIQRISTLGPELLVYRCCSDSSAPMLATTTQTDIILSASSHGEYSVTNQITSSDLPSPMYHTASEGPLRVRTIDSTLVTSSDLTSSDARLSRANETSPSIRLSEAIGDLRTRGEIDGMLAASSASHPGTLSSAHISSSSVAVSLDNTDVGCRLFPYSLHPPSVDSTPRNTSFNKIPNSPYSMPNPGDTSEATPQMKDHITS